MLENARRIADSGMTELSIRVPVVPGFNDTPEEIGAIAAYTRSLKNVRRMHLLPYHRLGQDKYKGPGTALPDGDVEPPTNEKMEMLLRDGSGNIRSRVPDWRIIQSGFFISKETAFL